MGGKLSNIWSNQSENINVINNIEKKVNNQSEVTFVVNDSNLLSNKSLNKLPWRRKKFESNYNCGTNTQNKKINGFLNQHVKYDCKVENDRCKSKLELNDNGDLILYTGNNYQYIRWRKKYNVGLPDNNKKATVGKNGRNYLLQGETLSPGDFIGSPNGTCFLTLENKSSDNGNINYQLVVKYKQDNYCPTNKSDKNNLYEVENVDITSSNKVAFITEEGKQKIYPDSMTSLSNDYFMLENYNPHVRNISNPLKLDVNSCKRRCNKNASCYGFVHDNKTGCYLKGSNIRDYKYRKPDNRYNLYLRKKQINKEYCPTDIVDIDLKTLNYIEKSEDIDSNYICNFTDKLTSLHQKQINADKAAVETANKIIGIEGMTNINNLYYNINKYNKLYSDYINKNNIDINNLNNIKSDIDDIIKNRPSVEGQLEDLKKNYYSEEYYYILLSIITIIFIIVSIKIANS